MKIYTFTTVKDESDIIESFVRYHMNIVDGMVISDNCSNDDTLEILKKLKDEGLNIDILEDDNQYFNQTTRRKELLEYTIENYKPDFVFPLDADEFISSYSNDNPRKIIEKLDRDYLYYYEMINYVVEPENKDNIELFVPSRLCCKRKNNENEGYVYKCFIPNNIYEKKVDLLIGCHTAKYMNGSDIDSIILKDLFLAHYPVRTKEQIMNKVITGRLNDLSLHSREEGFGFHQYEILDEIIRFGEISKNTLIKISENYGIRNKESIEIIKNDPIDISFCKNIEIKYYNPETTNILSNTIKAAETIIGHLREGLKKCKCELCEQKEMTKVITEKNQKLQNQVNQLVEENSILVNEKNNLNTRYNLVVNSKTWKLRNKVCKYIKRN